MKKLFINLFIFLIILTFIGCTLTEPEAPDPDPVPTATPDGTPGPTSTEDKDDKTPTPTPEPQKVTMAKNIILYLGSTFTNIGTDLAEVQLDRLATATGTITLNGATGSFARLELVKKVLNDEIYLDQVYTFSEYISPTLTADGDVTVSSRITDLGVIRPMADIYNDSTVAGSSLVINGTPVTLSTIEDFYGLGFIEKVTANMGTNSPALNLLQNFAMGIPGKALINITLTSKHSGTVDIETSIAGAEGSVGISGSYVEFTFNNYSSPFEVGGTSGNIELNGTVTGTPTVELASVEDLITFLSVGNQGDLDPSLTLGASFSGSLELSVSGVTVGVTELNDFNLNRLRYAQTLDIPDYNYYGDLISKYNLYNIHNFPVYELMSFISDIKGSITVNGVTYDRACFENMIVLDGILYDVWAEANPGLGKDSDEFKEFKLFYKFYTLTLRGSLYKKLMVAILDDPFATSYTIYGNKGGSATIDKNARTVTLRKYQDNDAIITGAYIYEYDYESAEHNYTEIVATLDAGIICAGPITGAISYDYEIDLPTFIDGYTFSSYVVPAFDTTADNDLVNNYYRPYNTGYHLTTSYSATDCASILALLRTSDLSSDVYTMTLPASIDPRDLNVTNLTVEEKTLFDSIYTGGYPAYIYNNSINDGSTDAIAEAFDVLANAQYNAAPTAGSFETALVGYELYEVYAEIPLLADKNFFRSLYETTSELKMTDTNVEYFEYALKTPALPAADEEALKTFFTAINFISDEGTKTITVTTID